MPDGWSPPDQLPAALAAVLARPGRPEFDLSDTVRVQTPAPAHGNGRSPRVHEEVPS
jgi:hypothetical protein